MALPDDATPHAVFAPMRVHTGAARGGSPSGPNSTKVAWTVRKGGKIVGVFSFEINPQGISRVESSRSQVQGTKGGFYVNDFGAGPSQITLRQIVASGRTISSPKGLIETYTLREDVQRFIVNVYEPATLPVNRGRLQVYFHDNHLERGHEERVLFPPNGLSLQRSVDLQGVWLLELQMTGLEVRPFQDVEPDIRNVGLHSRRYVVRRGDTLHKLVVRLAGKHASQQRRRAILARLLKLNPQIRRRRTLRIGSTNYIGDRTITVKAMHIAAGEVLWIPAARRASGGGRATDGPYATGGRVQQ